MSAQITGFTITDYDDAIAFWRKQEGIGLNESDSRENIALFLERNRGMSFIAREGEAVIGAVLCGHDGRRGYLHHLAVAPSHRTRGLGRKLVELCLDELREIGITKCSIFLYADNVPGRGFWRAIGYRPREDLLLMQRVLIGEASAGQGSDRSC